MLEKKNSAFYLYMHGFIFREQWFLINGAVVAHLGSSGGSLVATIDCETAVPGSNPAISPACSGLPVLRGLPSGITLCCRMSSQGWQRRIRGINNRDFCNTENN
jgi:hypothetical protein